ncbi:MAG TPA: tetratricopeptide repeat protein [bacterium]|jgi:tetratricopeptide (TPR) repeat protein|nr:tetratricopeptide repeat protein [bacterium]
MKKLLAKARSFYKKERYPEALPIAKQVLVTDKLNDEALFMVAHCLYYARRFRQSLRFWKQLEKIQPNEPYLHLNMGACYDDLGQAALAIKNFKRELELDPACGKALYNLGSLYYRARKPKLAVNYLERCYSQKHSIEAVVAKLAWCYFKTGQAEKEQVLYEQWLLENPDDTWALNNLGSHLMGQGEYNRALLRLKRAARLDPSDKVVAKNIRKAERLCKKTK